MEKINLKWYFKWEYRILSIILILYCSYIIYIQYDYSKSLNELAIYGCPYTKFNCNEDEKRIVDYNYDGIHLFKVMQNGEVYDPYGNYRKMQLRNKSLIGIALFIFIYSIIKYVYQWKHPGDYNLKERIYKIINYAKYKQKN